MSTAAPLPNPPARKKIQTSAVRSGDARHAVAASAHVAVLELPVEENLCVAAW